MRERQIIDPTNFRLNEYFVLSDFMGCDSVYRYGYHNRFYNTAYYEGCLRQCSLLVTSLKRLTKLLGPISISYGFISPELSRKIVKYQNPDVPSYHRWDKGAAADIIFHWEVHEKRRPPIYTAAFINAQVPYFDRLITYSESPYICFAVNTDNAEMHKPRNALYETRYMGVGVKPKHIKYPMGKNRLRARMGKLKDIELEHPWEGAGYPTYHGGGRQQYQHMRVSDRTMVSDFLYYKTLVHRGIENRPPSRISGMRRWMEVAKSAGQVYDEICSRLQTDSRPSITAAYNKHIPSMDWSDHFTMELADPNPELLLKIAQGSNMVNRAWIVYEEEVPKVRIVGEKI